MKTLIKKKKQPIPDIDHLQLNNVNAIELEIKWLSDLIDIRMKLHWANECAYTSIHDLLAPDQLAEPSYYGQFIEKHNLSVSERIILILALVPDLLPQLLDIFYIKNSTYDRSFTEFGGMKGKNYSGFLPTGETAAFILCGNDLHERLELFKIFNAGHFLFREHILKPISAEAGEPFLSGLLGITSEYLTYFISGKSFQPEFTSQFPARQIFTKMEWADLVLNELTLDALDEIKDWMKFGDLIRDEWGMGKSIKPGYRALFYGPPGTGKTLTVSLLGKAAGMDVYCIDLSMVVSKYIGETEKNLSRVFDLAAHKNWILFFDEADALFGKRTMTSSSNDRYANQEVSYLLQRIEDYPGVVILATNLKANMDDAFSRRFQSMIYFPVPGPEQRLRLWQQAIPPQVSLAPTIDLFEIARKYELTGGSINNISLYVLLKASKRADYSITEEDLINGIRKEFSKDGKTVV